MCLTFQSISTINRGIGFNLRGGGGREGGGEGGEVGEGGGGGSRGKAKGEGRQIEGG